MCEQWSALQHWSVCSFILPCGCNLVPSESNLLTCCEHETVHVVGEVFRRSLRKISLNEDWDSTVII